MQTENVKQSTWYWINKKKKTKISLPVGCAAAAAAASHSVCIKCCWFCIYETEMFYPQFYSFAYFFFFHALDVYRIRQIFMSMCQDKLFDFDVFFWMRYERDWLANRFNKSRYSIAYKTNNNNTKTTEWVQCNMTWFFLNSSRIYAIWLTNDHWHTNPIDFCFNVEYFSGHIVCVCVCLWKNFQLNCDNSLQIFGCWCIPIDQFSIKANENKNNKMQSNEFNFNLVKFQT